MKILIVRVSSLGDVVHNMPMLADIKRHHPDAQIDWVVEEAYADLIRLNRHVSKVISYAQRRWRKSLFSSATRAEIRAFREALKHEAYDVVFDTQGLLKTGIVMGMARIAPGGKKAGLANGTEGSGYEGLSRLFHTMSVPVNSRTHAVQRGRLVAAAALGYTVDTPADFALDLPQITPDWLPQEPYVVFFHGTARDTKKWPHANWVETGNYLQQAHRLPVLLAWGSEKEKQEAEQLAAQLPNARVLPRLSMLEAVLLAGKAALAVGVDTGLTHIAAAYNRPTIELYIDSPRWKTEGDWSPNIINLGDGGLPPSIKAVTSAVSALLR